MRCIAMTAVLAVCLMMASTAAHAGTLTSASVGLNQLVVSTGTGGLVATGTSAGSASVAVQLAIPVISVTRTETGPPLLHYTTAFAQGPPSGPPTQTQSLVWSQGGSAVVNQRIVGWVHFDLGVLPHSFGHRWTLPISAGDSFVIPGGSGTGVSFLGWRTGAFSHVSTSNGNTFGTLTAVGSNALTPNGGGTLTLIAPSIIDVRSSCSVCQIQDASLATVTTLTLNFVPEPSSALLLALAFAASACVGSGGRAAA